MPEKGSRAGNRLREERCSYCARDSRCDGRGANGKPYTVRVVYGDIQCSGFKSKYIDERKWSVDDYR